MSDTANERKPEPGEKKLENEVQAPSRENSTPSSIRWVEKKPNGTMIGIIGIKPPTTPAPKK
jgi:hypothetical protein